MHSIRKHSIRKTAPSYDREALGDTTADLLDEIEARNEEILQLHERLAAAEALRTELAAANARAAYLARAVLAFRAPFIWLRLGWLLRRCGWRTPLEDAAAAIRAQGLFNAEWYLARNPDVARSGHDPLAHYLLFGAYEGRDPNPYFDSAFYLQTHADVRASGINPLAHYAQHGWREGRAFNRDHRPEGEGLHQPDGAGAAKTPLGRLMRHEQIGASVDPLPILPEAPDWNMFVAIAERWPARNRPEDTAIVDVIVPVYRGRAETLICLHSVLGAPVRTAYELVVIDDASPEPDLCRDLQALADLGLITLLKNDVNLGFPGSVNRGLALHPKRDAVLLNSDTQVYGDWLDRLLAHAKGDVATVTPFSNTATICSYPLACRANDAPPDADCAALDAMAARVNRGQSVPVPTGVGFCMAVRREVLRRIGAFDAAAFGRGYGEENDLCLRAAAAGWRNVMALDVFVRHTGERSFAETADAAREAGLRTVLERHPGFHEAVQAHIAADPAAPARARLDAARLLAHLSARESVLCFSHARGGGIERHLSEAFELLRAEGIAQCTLQPSPGKALACDVVAPDGLFLPNLRNLTLSRGALLPALEALAPKEIQVHSLVGWPSHALILIPAIASALRVPLTVMLHDYTPVCPMIHLIDASGLYCGEAGEPQCRDCIAASPQTAATAHGPTPFGPRGVEIASWRRAYARLLRQADHVLAPSEDTARRMRRHFPEIAIEVRPHRETPSPPMPRPARKRADGGPLRVVAIGAIGPHKGAAVIEACAWDAAARRLPLEFVIAGYSDRDERLLALGNVRITGRYRDDSIIALLESLDADIAFLPSVWPETYCYTLSIVRNAGLPVAVFDLGAQAERLDDGYPHLKLPLALARQPGPLNDCLMDFARRA